MKLTLNGINSWDRDMVSRRAAGGINSFSAPSSRLTAHTICSPVAFPERKTNYLGDYDFLKMLCL